LTLTNGLASRLVYMLIVVSKTVFISIYTLLVAVLFSASAQLVSSDLLSYHCGSGADEVALEKEDT
jgi:hypothetical protein